MKRSILFIVVLALLMGGCSNASKDRDSKSLYYGKQQLSLGMEKAAVDKILGEGKKTPLNGIFEYNKTRVMYIDDKAASFLAEDEGFQTDRGIKVGDSVDSLKKAYGDDAVYSESSSGEMYSIFYQEQDGAVNIITDNSDKNFSFTHNLILTAKDGKIIKVQLFTHDALYGSQ